jgi:hypothetical protein
MNATNKAMGNEINEENIYIMKIDRQRAAAAVTHTTGAIWLYNTQYKL